MTTDSRLQTRSGPKAIYGTRVWRNYWRPLVLSQEPFCGGYPEGYHQGAAVATDSVDHIIPLSADGPTVRSNLRALCSGCNSRKGTDERMRTWRSG